MLEDLTEVGRPLLGTGVLCVLVFGVLLVVPTSRPTDSPYVEALRTYGPPMYRAGVALGLLLLVCGGGLLLAEAIA